jgi:SagB-type dehydrogenase family enzyme
MALDAATPAVIELPPPVASDVLSLHDALSTRRSEREFTGDGLRLDEISNLLWAAQGITHAEGMRTAPSAGALYPLELSVAVGNVHGLTPGLYRYRPRGHALECGGSQNLLSDLRAVTGGQDCVGDAAAVFVFAAVLDRTTVKYGDRGVRYVLIEVGLAAQGLGLMAVGLGLGAVLVGSFDDDQVGNLLRLPRDHQPVVMMSVGRGKTESRLTGGG